MTGRVGTGITRVAFQGEPGAYSELAARKKLGQTIRTLPCRSFADVFRAVDGKDSDLGILPVENSTAGSITEAYDLLLEFRPAIVGEVYLPIEHCLIIRSGADVAGIRRVSSHPQALAQCRSFLESRALESCPVEDTAGAARWLAERGTGADAVLASSLAAELYGLEIAVRGVQNEALNTTRFLLVAREPVATGAGGEFKTSLVLELAHEPGALFQAIKGFGEAGLNLTKIESRPVPERNWEYRFYIDFEGHHRDEGVARALAEVARATSTLIVFGSYPRSTPD